MQSAYVAAYAELFSDALQVLSVVCVCVFFFFFLGVVNDGGFTEKLLMRCTMERRLTGAVSITLDANVPARAPLCVCVC